MEPKIVNHLPVMLPIAASAYSSCKAAVRLANVSGTLVPRATIDTPLAAVRKPITQPKREASYKHIKVTNENTTPRLSYKEGIFYANVA